MLGQGIAFDRGLTAWQNLVETLAQPFLQLARKISQEAVVEAAPARMTRFRNNMFLIWAQSVTQMVASANQILRPKKRAAFVKALIEANFVEVGQLWGFKCVAYGGTDPSSMYYLWG